MASATAGSSSTRIELDVTSVVKVPDLPQLPGGVGIDCNVENSGKVAGDSKAPWSSLFKMNRMPSKGLKIPKVDVDDSDEVCIGLDELNETKLVWKATLIGYIGGKFPERQAIIDTCKSWNVHFLPYFHSSGWIVFKFDNLEDMHKVLCNGPYLVYGRPILLKEVPPFFNFDDRSISLMPIWIKLPGLPLECWSAKALGRIVSKVGTPIATDQLTAEVASYSYARVLVEVDVSRTLRRTLNIQLPGDRVFAQSIEYEFEPKFCTKCRRLGHVFESCRVGVDASLKGKNVVDSQHKRGRSRSRMRRQLSRVPKDSLVKDAAVTIAGLDSAASSSKNPGEIRKPPAALVKDVGVLPQNAETMVKRVTPPGHVLMRTAATKVIASVPAVASKLLAAAPFLPGTLAAEDPLGRMTGADISLPEGYAADAEFQGLTATTLLPKECADESSMPGSSTVGASLKGLTAGIIQQQVTDSAKLKGLAAENLRQQVKDSDAMEAATTLSSDSDEDGRIMNDLLGMSIEEVRKLNQGPNDKANVSTEAERRAARTVFFADMATEEELFMEVKSKKKSKAARKKGKGGATVSS